MWLDWSTAIREREWPRYLDFQGKVIAAFSGTIERGQRDGTIYALYRDLAPTRPGNPKAH